MDDIVIAVEDVNQQVIESAIRGYNYRKDVNGNAVYFYIPNIPWNENYEPQVDHIINTLSNLGRQDYAFVRLGNEVDDTEIHGSIQNFNITVKRSINY